MEEVDVVLLAEPLIDDSERGQMLQALIEEIMRLRSATIRAQVSKFHEVYDQPVGDKPKIPDDKTIEFRISLIGEEFCEMLDAVYPDDDCVSDIRTTLEGLLDHGEVRVDLPELVDAWGDLDYVVEGSRLAFGVNGEPIAAEIQRSNLSKLGADGKPVRREDGKILKGPNFTPPDIAGKLREQGWDPGT